MLLRRHHTVFRGNDHAWNWGVYRDLLALGAGVKPPGSITSLISPHEATKEFPTALVNKVTNLFTKAVNTVNGGGTPAQRRKRLRNRPGCCDR